MFWQSGSLLYKGRRKHLTSDTTAFLGRGGGGRGGRIPLLEMQGHANLMLKLGRHLAYQSSPSSSPATVISTMACLPLRLVDLLSSVAAPEIRESELAMGEHRLSFFLVSRNHVPGAESCWLLL
jgi:hypothetical protein